MHKIIDIISNTPLEGYKLSIPLTQYLFEPFWALAQLFLSFENIPAQIISWLIWLLIIVTGVIWFKKREIWITLKAIFITFILFILFLLYTVLFPFPLHKIRLLRNDILLADFHNHTYYSHDGIATVNENNTWHISCGFNCWAITDHDTIDGYLPMKNACAQVPQKSVIIPGVEISDKYGNHLLILGTFKNISGGRETAEIVSEAHKENACVIVAHIWTNSFRNNLPIYKDLEYLKFCGVDGFEIYSREKKPLFPEYQKELINFCKKNNLVMLGGTNWHGWGNYNTIWTAIELPGWQEMSEEEISKKIVKMIQSRKRHSFKVLMKSTIRPVVKPFFAPFIVLFLYFTQLSTYQLLSWVVWIIVFYFVIKVFKKLSIKERKAIINFRIALLSVMLLIESLIFIIKWSAVKSYNKVLLELFFLFSIMAIISIGIFLIRIKFQKET